jgi:hypothetical protein
MMIKILIFLLNLIMTLASHGWIYFGGEITLEENERAVYIDQNGQAILLLPGEDSVSSRFHHVIYSDETRTYLMTSTPVDGERVFSSKPLEFSFGEQKELLIEATLKYHYDLDRILDLHKKWVMFHNEKSLSGNLIGVITRHTTISILSDIQDEEYLYQYWDEIENEILGEIEIALIEEGIIVDSFRIDSVTEK